MGVAHLAHTLADRIYSLQRGELDITRSDVKCAEVAGATPFSISAPPLALCLACNSLYIRTNSRCQRRLRT